MKNKILFILFISNLYFNSSCWAQAEANPQMISPEAATLGKFGAYPVSYYTGTPDITIPLYTIKEKQVEIPISLSYDASGVLVNNEPGLVGQNWRLNAGGAIVRTVNGVPDEQSYPFYGYWYGINNPTAIAINENQPIGQPASVKDIKTLSFINNNLSVNIKFDQEPDLFTFNFCGYNGRFLIGNDKQVKVISDRSYKVDLSNFAYVKSTGNNYINDNNGGNSQITITADDGVQFIFGGSIEKIEYTPQPTSSMSVSNAATNQAFSMPTGCTSGIINTWYLSKIKCPNGDFIDFNYDAQDHNLDEHRHYDSYGTDYDYLKKIYSWSYYYDFDKCLANGTSTPTTSIGEKMSLVKTAYLHEIKTSTGTDVVFSTSVKPKSYYGDYRVFANKDGAFQLLLPTNTKQLDSITVNNVSNTTVKQLHFTYDEQLSNNNCYRYFLNGLSVNGIENYSFDYYDKDKLPDPLSQRIDFWGYFNNVPDAMTATSVSTTTDPFSVNFSARNTNKLYTKYGLLKTITFPTKGYTQFDYEANDYSKVIRNTSTSGTSPAELNETGNAGGARIFEIKDVPGNSQPEVTRHFYYKQNYSSTNTSDNSSGILIDRNVYFIGFKFKGADCWVTGSPNDGIRYFSILKSDNITQSSSIQSPHIGYSEVTEVSSNGGYTKYYFTNASNSSRPDKYVLSDCTTKYVKPDVLSADFTAQMQRILRYSSCEIERGKLAHQISYNSNDLPVKDESFTYNEAPSRYDNAVYTYDVPLGFLNYGVANSYAIYYFQNLLTQKTTTVYDINGNNGVSTTENDTYSNKLLSTKTITNSDGTSNKISYKYPFEYDLSHYDPEYSDKNSGALHNMILYNIINTPVEATNYKSDKVIGSQLTLFNCNSSGFKTIDRTLRWESNIPYSDSFTSTTNAAYPYKFVYNANYKDYVVYDQYDSHGNLLQYHKTDGINVSILWSYNYQYPIAEIKNATYTDIQAALGYNDAQIESLAASSTPDVSSIRTKLTSYFSTKKSFISTCTYIPLVGILTKTDPRGVTSYYNYDTFNRLQNIKDKDGKIIKTFDYNYLH